MKQIIQSLKNGAISIIDVPSQKKLKDYEIRVKTECTLISPGTERFLLKFGESNLIKKALDNPERVKEVITKIKNEGLIDTLEAVNSKLDLPLALGYSNVGIVSEVGNKVDEFKSGDRVLSNGAHAEEIITTQNTCIRIPKTLKSEIAVFGILGSISLQGIRLLKPNFGEIYVISGLGIIGLLSCQILEANGCKVIGIDPDENKCMKAKKYGIKTLTLENNSQAKSIINDFANNKGVDGVLICANTSSSEPIHLAAEVCRTRGKIVLIGVTGLEFRRDLLYEKEISFQVSCSYGPGRYDPKYEIDCNDYPYGFVRWTEKRNIESILHSLNKNQINIDSLITNNFDFKDASSAYQLLKTDRSATGLILNFNSENIKKENNYSINYINSEDKTKKSTGLKVGFIGAGNYAASKLLPAFSKTGANMFSISSQSALKPYHLARKYKFKNLTTDIDQILKNDDIKVVVISTKHDSHAEYIKKAYENNKHVFVEKPICVNNEELSALKDLYLNSKNKNILMVGFNRRFSKLITNIKENLDNNKTPKSFIYNINSSKLPNNHWINKREQGGRLIGEACHFIDLLRYLSGSKINNKNIYRISDEDFIISLKFCNGDIATVNYNCGGTKSFPKERLEIFGGGEIITLDNFKKIKYWNNPLRNRERFFTQDKGHSNCAKAFIDCVENFKTAPIPLDEIFEVQSVLLELTQS